MGEHRWLVEQSLGRKLSPNEHVHHINGNGLDNRLENLAVLESRTHLSEHATLIGNIEAIKALFDQGLSLRKISEQTGHHRNTIRRWLTEAGVLAFPQHYLKVGARH